MSAVSNFDAEQVMGELQKENFDIGDNPYGQLTSIIDYTTSIFNAIESLHQSWIGAVGDADFYFSNGEQVPEAEDPTGDTGFLESGKGTLKGVNTFLNVRSSVGTNKEVVGTLTNGTPFTIIGASGKDKNGVNWYHVKYKDENGQEVEGYVSGDYISVDASSLSSNGSSSTGSSKSSASGTSSNTGSRGVSNSSGSSASTSTSGGVTSGGNSSKTTGVVSNIKDVGSHLNIRSTADLSDPGNIIGGLSNGTKLEILGEENGFYRIKTENGVGYVSKDYVTLPQNSVIPSTTREIPAKTTVILNDKNTNLNFRSAPNTNNPGNIISGIKDGTELDVIDRSGDWTKVKYNDQVGWVYTKYLTK